MLMEMATVQAIKRDIIFAQELFSSQNVIWPRTLSWLRIKNYRLPPYYSEARTDLLVIMPPQYGIVNIPLQEFYMTRGLKIKTGKGWRNIPHYYSGSYNKFSKQGWAWYCIHPKSWEETDSILTFIKLIDMLLENPFKERT